MSRLQIRTESLWPTGQRFIRLNYELVIKIGRVCKNRTHINGFGDRSFAIKLTLFNTGHDGEDSNLT